MVFSPFTLLITPQRNGGFLLQLAASVGFRSSRVLAFCSLDDSGQDVSDQLNLQGGLHWNGRIDTRATGLTHFGSSQRVK